MKLIFFDESKNEQAYPHYHLGGLLLDDSILIEVERQIQLIAQEVFGTAELSRETEFHAAEIYHRKKNFKGWANFGDRVFLLGRFVDILSRKDIQKIDIQINCDLLADSQSPAEIAFMYLCERANALVGAEKSLGMLIGDRENDDYAARYATALSGYRVRRTGFTYGRKLNNLVDSVHCTHSHLSRFLQLADIYVWLVQFGNRHCESAELHHAAVFQMLGRENVDLSAAKYKEWPNQKFAAKGGRRRSLVSQGLGGLKARDS